MTGSHNAEKGQAMGGGRDKDGKREQRPVKGGRTKARGNERDREDSPKETLGRRGNGFGDTREEMKEEVRDNSRERERTPSLRPDSRVSATEVGGDGATRPKRGHRVGWGRPAVRAQ